LKSFQEAYPGIEVEFYKASQNDLFSKIRLEQNSKIYKADIIQFGLTPTIVAEYMPEHMAWNYVPPMLMDLIDEENREPVLIHRFNFFSVIYNPTLFDEPPIDTWWDLTRPEWKGKVLTDDPYGNDKMFYNLSTFADHADEFAAAYEKEFGKPIELDKDCPDAGYQWVKDFLENEPIMAGPKDLSNSVGGPDVTERLLAIIVSGRFVDVATGKSNFEPVLELEPIAGAYDGLSVLMANMAPHPNAAKLVIRWMYGDSEGGAGYTPWYTSGLIPARNDVSTPDYTPVDLEILTSKFWRYDYDWVYNNLPTMRDFWTAHIVN
jgi:iron(III) transport system substrate-binding protein